MHTTVTQARINHMYRLFVTATVAVLLAACSSPDAPSPASPSSAASTAPAAQAERQAAVRSLVERFGEQMQKVSTLAPPDAMHRQLQDVYGDLLSPTLIGTWQTHPDRVVGRKVSSPWPQRIEIGRITCSGENACRVTGQVDYVTSQELVQGGVFMRRDIKVEVARGDQGWRITSVRLASAPQAEDDAAR